MVGVSFVRLCTCAGAVMSFTVIVHVRVFDVPFGFVAFTETVLVPLTLQLVV